MPLHMVNVFSTSFYRCMKSGSMELSLYNLEWLLRAVCGGAGVAVVAIT